MKKLLCLGFLALSLLAAPLSAASVAIVPGISQNGTITTMVYLQDKKGDEYCYGSVVTTTVVNGVSTTKQSHPWLWVGHFCYQSYILYTGTTTPVYSNAWSSQLTTFRKLLP